MYIPNNAPPFQPPVAQAADHNGAAQQRAAAQPHARNNLPPAGLQATRRNDAARNRLAGNLPAWVNTALWPYIATVRNNPGSAEAVYNLGCMMTAAERILVDRTPMTRQECYLKAIELDSRYANAFIGLGTTMTATTPIDVHGTSMTQRECYLKGIELGSRHASAFVCLGNIMTAAERILVDRTPMTRQECYLKAIELDPRCAIAFSNLGTTMTANTPILVDRTPMTKQQCYLKAIELDPRCASAFVCLGSTMTANTAILVDRTPMTQRGCYQKALEIAPGYTFAQAGLQRLDQAEAAAAASTAIVTAQGQQNDPYDTRLTAVEQRLDTHDAQLTAVEHRLNTHDRILTHLQNDIDRQLDAPAPPGRPALPDNPHLLAYHLTFRKSMALLYTTTQLISSGKIQRSDEGLLASAVKAIAQSIPVPFLGAAVGAMTGMFNMAANNRAGTGATLAQSRLGEVTTFTHLAHDVASMLCNDRAYREGLLDKVPDWERSPTPAAGRSILQRVGLTRLKPAATPVQIQAESDVKRLSNELQAHRDDRVLQHATSQLHAGNTAPMAQWMSELVLGRSATAAAVIASMASLSVRTVNNPHYPALIAELVDDGFLDRSDAMPDSPPSKRYLRIMSTSTDPEAITAAATAFYDRTVARDLQR